MLGCRGIRRGSRSAHGKSHVPVAHLWSPGQNQREVGATGVQLKAFLTVQVSPGRAGIILWMGLKLRGGAHGAGGSGSIAGTSKALGSFWCTLCASPVSPSHADQKRIPEHLAGGSRQGINLSLRSSRAYIFQNHHPTWFLSSWLFSSFPASTRHTERQPQSKNQAVREAWLAALPRSGDKEHWHGWQECQAHSSSALAFG